MTDHKVPRVVAWQDNAGFFYDQSATIEVEKKAGDYPLLRLDDVVEWILDGEDMTVEKNRDNQGDFSQFRFELATTLREESK